MCLHLPKGNTNVKTFCGVVLTATTLLLSTLNTHALFGHVQAERERRQDAEQRITQEQQTNEHLVHGNERLHIIITILSAGVVAALLVGAAVGSKARRDAQQP